MGAVIRTILSKDEASATYARGWRKFNSAGVYLQDAGYDGSTAGFPDGQLNVSRFTVDKQFTVSAISVEVTVAGVAGTKVRPAIYADSDGEPGALIHDAGQLEAESTGVKTASGLSVVLAPGAYHVGAAAQGGAPTLKMVRRHLGGPNWFASTANAFDATRDGRRALNVTGAAPDPFTAGGGQGSGVPLVALTAA